MRVELSPMVDMSLNQMDPAAVDEVRSWIGRLERWGSGDPVEAAVVQLKLPDVYMLRMLPGDKRVIFRVTEDAITVICITDRPTILATVTLPGGDV